MRKILAFSDLHASRRALSDVESIIKEFDLSIFCGDILGYGRDIDYCIDYVLNNVDLAIIGNHDRLAITNEDLEFQPKIVKESILYTRSRLSAAQIEALLSLPKEIRYEDIFITHSIDDDYLRNEDDFKKLCRGENENTKFIFFGHTHEQVLYKYNNKIVINPGSIAKGRKGFHRSYTTVHGNDIKIVNLDKIL